MKITTDFSALKVIQEQIEQLAPKIAEKIIYRVKRRTPVRSGRLRDGWNSSITPSKIIIYNDVDYAPYIEYGTPTIEPVGMLRTTLEEIGLIVKEIL